MRRPTFGIRDRVAVTVVLSVLAACMMLVLDQSRRAREHADAVFAAQTTFIAGQARPAVAKGDSAAVSTLVVELRKAAGGLSAYNTLVSLAAYDRNGSLLAGMAPNAGGAIESEAREAIARSGRTFERAGGQLLVSMPIVADGSPELDGFITAAWNTSNADAAIHDETVANAAKAIVGSLLLMLAVMVTLDRCFVEPVKRLQTQAGAIARDGVAAPMGDNELAARPDEIGDLARSFDTMIGEIAEGQARVASRSMELQARNMQFDAALATMSQGLCMYDGDGRLALFNQRFAVIFGLPPGAVEPGDSFSSVLEQMRSHGGLDEQEARRTAADLEQALREGARIGFSLRLSDGRTISVAHAAMERGGWLATYEDISERVAAESQMNHMAHHDPLTGLPNRSFFRQVLVKETSFVRRGSRFATMCIDLDHFKAVNDTLGHPIGDQLLSMVAGRLRECVREHDTVARLGGDEFAVVQTDNADAQGASSLAKRIIETLSRPYEIAGHNIVIGASVGVAVSPGDSDDPDQLLKCADMALYRAKFDGRGTHRFFEAEMDARMQERRMLEIELRAALQQDQFEVHFQPLVNIESQTIAGFEALVRWNHPQRGLVPPGDFIPLAEEINLIGDLGLWVLRRATAEAAQWAEPLKISINLSPVQFRSASLVDDILAAVAEAKLDPRRLELEITESVLLADTEHVLAKLHRLRDAGVSIAMDDFGTGYSSLGYLQKFPFDRIKIDRSFVTNMRERSNALSIIKAITDLGSCLGIATTAEGVETSEQLEELRNSGCSIVQGYLFSAAIPAKHVQAMIEEYNQSKKEAA